MSAGGRTGKQGGRRWRLLGRHDRGGDAGSGGARGAVADAGQRAAAAGCVRIGDCAEGPAGRPVVRVRGTLRAVRERSVAGMPALWAELHDGSDSLEMIWLGRREIAGIVPGRELIATGRIAVCHGRPVLFNPRYQLEPRGQE